ncbi:MAG: TonB-dependent siderophore receptor [Gemmatimonadaceae bacterium]|nr:TonB-dependent siderophore receptor [Gemmatimonadaceae bacterium]
MLAAALQQDTTTAPRDSAARRAAPARPAAQALGRVEVRADGARAGSYRPATSRSSTKTPTPLREIPQAITSFSAPLMRDLNLTNLQRAVEYVPGVVMGQGEGHRDAPTIRGQSTTADFFVDGVRDDAQYYRDTYNVAQLDALKGSNAAIFGRGGGGGVINRVMKQATFTPVRNGRVETASWNQRRVTLDIGQAIAPGTAARLNLLHEAGSGFRREFGYDRSGINPTVALLVGPVLLQGGAERFLDHRVVDRGLPSWNGRPSPMDARRFVGDPRYNTSRLTANSGYLMATWSVRPGLEIRSHTRGAHYDKFYQNTFASSALNAAGTQFTLGGYNTANDRHNRFQQTDVIWQAARGGLQHTLLLGAELSAQRTANRRETAYFNNASTTFAASPLTPTVTVPVTFRQSATDADNVTEARVAAVYAQEQLRVGRHVSVLGGVRHDRFTSQLRDRRSGAMFSRTDHLLAPRGALVLTPDSSLSFYGAWSMAYLPSSGDQFSALTASTATLAPEAFRNREAGVKWAAARGLDVTAAWFILDRSNTTAPDPLDPTRLVQTGRQQSRGVELGLQGAVTARWDVMGGVAVQRARVVSRTSSAAAGASVPLVPHTTASLWNKVRVTRRTALSLGVVHQGDRYAAIDNTVRLPRFTRVDAGLFLGLPLGLSTQLQVENLLDTRYAATSNGNNNIMPGSGRALRLSLSY